MAETCFELNRLCCAYGKQEILTDITIRLRQGKFYGLVGPNGSGKTTLLDHLIGHRQPVRGSLSLFDRPIGNYPKRELARYIALVPQDFGMDFDFTAEEIVRMGRHPHIPRFAAPSAHDDAAVAKAMREMDVTTLGHRPFTHLSGGEKQRVIAARALAQETPIIILDEATANLDIHHAIEIFKVIAKKVKDKSCTVIAAIHNLNFAAAYCDEIIMLHNRGIAHAGPVTDTLTPERIARVFAVACATRFDEYNHTHQVSFHYDN